MTSAELDEALTILRKHGAMKYRSVVRRADGSVVEDEIELLATPPREGVAVPVHATDGQAPSPATSPEEHWQQVGKEMFGQ